MKAEVIQTENKKNTEWGISIGDGCNPKPEDYFRMPDQQTANNVARTLNNKWGGSVERLELKKESNTQRDYAGCYGGIQNEDSLYFSDGVLEASLCGVCPGETRTIRMPKEWTLEVYKQMKRHFEGDLMD